ncbi:MAG TPA: ABC transporter permease subunit [Jatrophihabitans sp.]
MSVLADGAGLPGLSHVITWFNDPSNWWGSSGLLIRIREHLLYALIILLIAIVIALPLGLFVGHTGRGVVVVVGLANGLRAIPTLGLVIYLYLWLSTKITTTFAVPWLVDRGALASFVSVMIALVLLALPPILTSTYAGVQNVDPAARDAASGMGMTGAQVVRKVELPCALPLIMSGIRSAALQVIATVTVAAYLPFLGGLGRYIKDGAGDLNNTQTGYPAMVAAGLTVAILAVVVDALFNLLQRALVSPGLTGRIKRDSRRTTVDRIDAPAEANLISA